jgi:hypothetical protein
MNSTRTQPVSVPVETFATVAGGFTLLACTALAVAGWLASPTFHEMGVASYGTLVFCVVGLTVGGVDWYTAGRHRLMPLGVAGVALTLVSAHAGAMTGMLKVNEALGRPEVIADEQKYRLFSAVGYWEAMGNVPYGFTLALVQIAVLALAWRRAQLAALEG